MLSSESSEGDNSFTSAECEPCCSQPPAKKLRGKNKIITPKLAAALDACKISDRYAVHIISAVAESLGHNIEEYVLNRTSLHQAREQIREERVSTLRKKLKLNELDTICLHWDGKLLPALTGNDKVDRLPIIITSGQVEQLLQIPALNSGTGKEQAFAVCDTIYEYGLQNHIKALVFDTTAVNTGRFNGTCTLIENSLQRPLLWLPCRHHIYEIILKCVFDEKISYYGSPNVKLFEKFKNAWAKINKSNFEYGLLDPLVKNYVNESAARIINAVNTVLKVKQPREDYKEFLELTLLFLGEKPNKSHPNSLLFRSPGAVHHARWMAKAIYCLKIFLFRNEFQLSTLEINGLRRICIFIVEVYVEAWFSAPLAVEAPYQDFVFLRKLENFKNIDAEISLVALKKFKNHLWYLSPEAVGLAFFDNNVPVSTKQKMVAALENDCELEQNTKRVNVNGREIAEIFNGGIEQFVSVATKALFERFQINTNFLKLNPAKWHQDQSYKKAVEVMNKLKVVNDSAERGVKLMEEFNDLFTKNERQKQFVIKIVSDYRNRFPDCNKKTLTQVL